MSSVWLKRFRCDRNRHGGGIVVYVRDCLSTTPIIMDNVDLELLILFLTVNNRKTTIGTFYRPPNSSSELMDTLYACLENLDITCSQTSSFLVTSTLISVIHLITIFVSCLSFFSHSGSKGPNSSQSIGTQFNYRPRTCVWLAECHWVYRYATPCKFRPQLCLFASKNERD